LYAYNSSVELYETLFTVKEVTGSSVVITGSREISVDSAITLTLEFVSYAEVMPISYSFAISKLFDKSFNQMHPTIELGRYCPDWTFATYINALKNFFNLDIVNISKDGEIGVYGNDNLFYILTNQLYVINRLVSRLRQSTLHKDGWELDGDPTSEVVDKETENMLAGYETNITVTIPNDINKC